MKQQADAVNATFHELAVLQKKNRGRILPEEAVSNITRNFFWNNL